MSAPATSVSRRSRAFHRFLEFRYPDCLDMAAQVHAIPQKKGDVPALDYLDRDEVDALLKAPDTATRPGTRDRAMLGLAYNAGLRVSELVGLDLDDDRMPQLDEIRVVGKGRRARVLPLWRETGGALGAWLSIRPETTDRHLFLNAMGQGMTRRGFAKRLALHATTAARTKPSIAHRKVTPHVLRHACALHTLKATGDIRKVSLWLGAPEPQDHGDVPSHGSCRKAGHALGVAFPGARQGTVQGSEGRADGDAIERLSRKSYGNRTHRKRRVMTASWDLRFP